MIVNKIYKIFLRRCRAKYQTRVYARV